MGDALPDYLSGRKPTSAEVTRRLTKGQRKRMAEAAQSEFNARFCAEVKRQRVHRGWTQADLAVALDTTEGKVQKYETRTPLPHFLVPRFCTIFGITEQALYKTARMGVAREEEPAAKKPARVRRAAAE